MKKIILLIMIVLMSFSVCAACPASMVSYWQFEEADLGNEVDSGDLIWSKIDYIWHFGSTTDAKGGLSATGVNGINFAGEGVFGQGLSLDGIDDYAEVAHTSAFNFGNTFAVFLWAKNDGTCNRGDGSVSTTCYFVDKYANPSGASDNGWRFYYQRDEERIVFYKKSSGVLGASVSPTNSASLDNEWHQVGFVVNNQNVKLYYDGEMIKETTNLPDGIMDNTKDLAFGNYVEGSSTESFYFNGSMDEIILLDDLVSDAEIKALYERGAPQDEKDTNPGVNIGATSTTGKLGSALSFDGSDDYVDVDDDNSLSFGDSSDDGSFSISAWCNPNDATHFRIISKYDYDGEAEYVFQIDGGDFLAFCLYDADKDNRICRASDSTFTSYEGTWMHVVATYDGSESTNGMKLYLNREELDSSPSNAGSYTAMHNTARFLEIGSRITRGNYANGAFDEVAIYNTALTAQEVADLYAGSSNNYGYCSGAVQVTEPVWSGSLDLTTADGTAIDDTTNETTLQVRDGSNPLVEFTRSGSLNMSAFTIDSDSSRTVVNFDDVTGTTGTHTLFIPDNGGGVFICPDATSLGDVAAGCSNSVTIASCPGTNGVYSCTDEGSYFKITGLTGSGVGTTCNDCADCDTGLYCDLRDGTPTCKNSTLVAAVDCVDCVDNDADTLIDLDDPGCGGSSSGTSEVDGGGATIPEFNFVGYLLILVIAGIGLYFISKK